MEPPLLERVSGVPREVSAPLEVLAEG
jgi:hypothetical protein